MILVMNESKMFNNVTNSFFPKMNLLEHIYLLVRIKDDPIKTSVICSNLCVDSKFPYRVFHDVKIDYLTNLDPYKNNSLQMTLKVHHKDTTVEWITMKRSSIRNGGFGIFACRTFNVGELVTVYLGEMVPVMYRFQDIIAIHPKKKNGCFHDEYWFAHRINHKSGDLPNCRMNTCGVIRATKQIGPGDEIFIDYNRDCFCKTCKKDIYFFNLDSSVMEICVNCNKRRYCWKSCKKCKQFLCLFCYDYFQINA